MLYNSHVINVQVYCVEGVLGRPRFGIGEEGRVGKNSDFFNITGKERGELLVFLLLTRVCGFK